MGNEFKLKINKETNRADIINSYFSISFSGNGKADSLKFKSKELLSNLQGEPNDPDSNNSFYCDYHMKGQTINLYPDELRIIEDTDKIKHIAYIDNSGALGLEYHIIIKNNDTGMYSYVKAWNNIGKEFPINELRTVYRLNRDLFPIGYNGIRFGLQPSSAAMMKGEKIQDETYRMNNGSLYDSGSIYSKYDYSEYLKNTDLWGQYGHDYGLWVITPDKSAYGGGPLNQDLMIHYDAITLNYLVSEHFGKGIFTVPKKFEKIWGPWFVYLNNGDVEDATSRALEERKKWPYSWVNESDYKLNLLSVKGSILSEYKNKGYTVILTDTDNDSKPIHEQKSGFVYYTNTNKDGRFTLDKVRPGHYWMYAYGNYTEDLETHLLGEIDVDNDNIALPVLRIHRTSETIWQVGKGTHTTDGLKFSDELRNYSWQSLVPDNLDYIVGKSSDWYYLQNDQGIWNIHFSNSEITKDTRLELQISLAGVTQKDMKDTEGTLISLKINNKRLAQKHFPNDRAAYRSAMKSGAYHLWKLNIPITKIDKENKLSISTNGYIMYDSIRLLKKKEGKNDEE